MRIRLSEVDWSIRSPLRRDEVRIRPRRTPLRILWVLKRIRYNNNTPLCREETVMRDRFSSSLVPVAFAAAAVAGISMSATPASAQVPAGSGKPPPALTTPWGNPDLQGIWTDESDTALQRSPRYATHEFFTEARR